MKTSTLLLLVLGAIFGLAFSIAAVLGLTYVRYNNLGVSYETNIKSVYENSQVVLNSYSTKVVETAQVPAMMRDDVSSIVRETFRGRYGENGSAAVFQAISENNIQLDPLLYRQVQQVIEAGRDEFKMSQTLVIDSVKAYEAQLGYFWSGMWLSIAGFPKINLADYKIIVTDDVGEKFRTGKDSAIQLR